MTAALNVGLVGFGYAGRTLHAPLIRATPGLVLAAVSSRDAGAVHAALGPDVRVHDSADALIDDASLDLVVLASPNATHAPLARRALEAGRHVVIDKPMALHAAEAAPLLPLAQAARRVLSVFHNRRFDGDFLTAQALLADGTLGRVTEARLHFDRYRPQVRARWRESAEPGGGLFADLSPHLIDQALQLFGEPVALSADIMTLRDGGVADDAFECRLRYASGLRVTLAASMLAALPGPRFALHGTRGSWTSWALDPQEDALKAGLSPDAAEAAAGELCIVERDAGEPRARAWPTRSGRWSYYYAQLRDAMLGRGPNPVPPDQACRVLKLQDLARAAAAARRELSVEP